MATEPKLYVECHGKGPHLLLVHGSAVDASFYSDATRYLSQDFSVTTYDRRGYGRSGNPGNGDYSLAAQVHDLERVSSMTGGTVFLVGHSAGCGIVAEFAAQHPNDVAGILLVEPCFVDCLAADDPYFAAAESIRSAASAGKVSRALLETIELEGIGDERARPFTPEEASRRERNVENFFLHEGSYAFASQDSHADALARLHAKVGLGELSRSTYHARVASTLSKRWGLQVVAFPGSHNSPFDLPFEFAAITSALASQWPH